MATTFINTANATGTILGVPYSVISNIVTADLLLSVELTKTQLNSVVNHGGTQTYTIAIKNVNLTAITNVTFSDSIPIGMTYIVGTFKVNGIVTVPLIAAPVISYVIPSIAAGATTTITFDVSVT